MVVSSMPTVSGSTAKTSFVCCSELLTSVPENKKSKDRKKNDCTQINNTTYNNWEDQKSIWFLLIFVVYEQRKMKVKVRVGWWGERNYLAKHFLVLRCQPYDQPYACFLDLQQKQVPGHL
jgi:hypothetical protein